MAHYPLSTTCLLLSVTVCYCLLLSVTVCYCVAQALLNVFEQMEMNERIRMYT